jgi:prepilin-type processing-associated H-X9-DG protein
MRLIPGRKSSGFQQRGSAGRDAAAARIIDYPASYHNGAGGLSFADGHAEIRKWVDPRSKPKVKLYATPLNVPFPNNQDMVWLSGRTTVRR